MSKHVYWPHSEPEPAEEPPPVLCVGHHPDTPPPAAVTGRLCAECYRQLTTHLTELPGVVAWLHVNLAAGGVALGEERVTGSREAPTPLRMDVLDMIGPTKTGVLSDGDYQDQIGLDNIPDELTAWAGTVADGTEQAAPAGDVHTLCGWMLRQAGWIAGQDWVDEFLNTLYQLLRQAAGVAPWRAEHLRDRQEPCGHCGVLALVQHVAKGRIVCERGLGGCGQTRKVTEYEWRTRHLRTKTDRGVAS